MNQDAKKQVERYIEIWNEKDATARRASIAEVWTENCAYTDPLVAVEGHHGLDANIAAVQAQFPDLVFRLAGDVDAHHNVARFSWELGPTGAEATVVGFDVAVFAEDGRIDKVHGFFDKVPA